MAAPLQTAIDSAIQAGAMYSEYPNRIYNMDLFRSKVIDSLTAGGLCGAWDYGNVQGDEIYVRSADGCVIEQYDLVSGEGGVRTPGKGSNVWQESWGTPVPGPKPDWPRLGDLTCSLPGGRATFCFQIKGTQGEFGPELYAALREVLEENPQMFDPNDFLPGQGELIPDQLRVPAWRILDEKGYVAAVEKKIRARGFCGYVDDGILRAKKVSMGNIFHEEMDIIQNPASGGSYAGFVVKDRCHDADF
jgi:hypothetical protein